MKLSSVIVKVPDGQHRCNRCNEVKDQEKDFYSVKWGMCKECARDAYYVQRADTLTTRAASNPDGPVTLAYAALAETRGTSVPDLLKAVGDNLQQAGRQISILADTSPDEAEIATRVLLETLAVSLRRLDVVTAMVMPR